MARAPYQWAATLHFELAVLKLALLHDLLGKADEDARFFPPA